MSSPTFSQHQEPQRSGLMTALVAAAVIVLVAANVYLYVQIGNLRTDVAKMQEKMATEVSNLRDTSNVTSQSQARHIQTLKEELAATEAKARSATNQVKSEALADSEAKKVLKKGVAREE